MKPRLLAALGGLFTLGLAHSAAASAGDHQPVGAQPLPPVQAQISYVSREVTPDGITQLHSYQESWIRDGNTLWSERLIPASVVEAFHHHHDESKTPHKHFMYQMAARWVTRQANGELELNYVDRFHHNQVHYPATEYGQAGFEPNWSHLSQLFDPAQLAHFTPTGKTGEQGAIWYQQQQANQIIRVLWSEKLQLALEIERHTPDNNKQYHMTVKLQPSLPTPRPWQQLSGYEQKEISDFFD